MKKQESGKLETPFGGERITMTAQHEDRFIRQKEKA